MFRIGQKTSKNFKDGEDAVRKALIVKTPKYKKDQEVIRKHRAERQKTLEILNKERVERTRRLNQFLTREQDALQATIQEVERNPLLQRDLYEKETKVKPRKNLAKLRQNSLRDPFDQEAFMMSTYTQNSDYEDDEKPRENAFQKFRDRKAQ